mmetsp:Transcript_1249/g.2993  ORF Transcript_1249/g.2993 Transcript_1249/m.2993 type:complete len:114 (-) Transcript_1249:1276-1617(-)
MFGLSLQTCCAKDSILCTYEDSEQSVEEGTEGHPGWPSYPNQSLSFCAEGAQVPALILTPLAMRITFNSWEKTDASTQRRGLFLGACKWKVEPTLDMSAQQGLQGCREVKYTL